MNLDALFPYFSVVIKRTTAPRCLERAEFIDDPQDILANLLKSVLRAVVTSNHLLAPLHWILSNKSNDPIPTFLDSPASRWAYYADHAEGLAEIREELAYRFARAPISVLVVNTNQDRWAAVSACGGLESTILVEQRLVDIVLAGTPEGRLFGFATLYGHLFLTWYMREKAKRLCTPKIYPPGRTMTTEDRGEAGAFVEWAGLGGVTEWVQNQLYLQRSNEQYVFTREEAQSWWDSKNHPHLVDFLQVRRGSRLFPSPHNDDPFATPPSAPNVAPTVEHLHGGTIASSSNVSHFSPNVDDPFSAPPSVPNVAPTVHAGATSTSSSAPVQQLPPSSNQNAMPPVPPNSLKQIPRHQRMPHYRRVPYKADERNHTRSPSTPTSDTCVGSFRPTADCTSVVTQKDEPIRGAAQNGWVAFSAPPIRSCWDS